MSEIQSLVGFNLMTLAISIVVICIMGVEFDVKEKVIGILLEIVVMGLVSAGVYLMTR